MDFQACGRAFNNEPQRADVYQRYMHLARFEGAYDAMERHSRAVLEQEPARNDALFYLAYAMRKQQRYDDAIKAYRAYQARFPSPDTDYGIALCYEGLGDASAAVKAYRRYIRREARPERRAWRQRAKARVAHLDAQARRQRPAPVAVPRPPSPRGATGNCDKQRQIISRNPFDTVAYEDFARCAKRIDAHLDIVRHMRMALRDNPEFARGWLHLGLAQIALGRKAYGEASLKRACQAGVSQACAMTPKPR